jgi:hypothetical protein
MTVPPSPLTLAAVSAALVTWRNGSQLAFGGAPSGIAA